jgi:hypothetical protein
MADTRSEQKKVGCKTPDLKGIYNFYDLDIYGMILKWISIMM